jgi:two-component system response regulator HydG
MHEKSFFAGGNWPADCTNIGLDLFVLPSKKASVVCVLDDDPSVLKAACRLLDSAGWKVEPFNDPIAFLEYATIRHPRVAVIDILMPAMNGLEVQTRLRSASPSTRVIILTSKDDPLVRSRAMESGASAFFLKCAGNEELLAGIASAMNGN